MNPTGITPPASGTATPNTISSLADQHIANQAPNSNLLPKATGSVAALDASALKITRNASPREVPALNDPAIASSSICTDHMVTVSWTLNQGWHTPELKPYGPFSIMPTASVFHYATECFEGMKLYRGHDNKLRFFRPNRNCERMRGSVNRIALPDFDPKELEKLILTLAKIDGPKWLPRDSHKGKFLYCRPTMISDDASLGVQRPKQALLFVILTVFPDMSDPKALDIQSSGLPAETNQIHGLKLLASTEDTIRAWPGGFGYAKLGANYGPSLVSQGVARDRGFNQILWLLGPESHVTEAGASNFFVVWRNKETNETELVTAGLEDKVILEGVTRASILQLAEERLGSELKVVERKYTMQELKEAVDEGRCIEAFAAGTAFFVAPVGLIEWKGKELRIPTSEGATGKYARLLRGWLSAIMYGEEKHEWGVVIEED